MPSLRPSHGQWCKDDVILYAVSLNMLCLTPCRLNVAEVLLTLPTLLLVSVQVQDSHNLGWSGL